MNRDEMAEWLAENVLNIQIYGLKELVSYVYSPEGFFAVWDAIDTFGVSEHVSVQIEKYKKDEGYSRCVLVRNFEVKSKLMGKGRYEAFYNAIFEALKDES